MRLDAPRRSVSAAYRKSLTRRQHHAALNGGMTYAKSARAEPKATTSGEIAKTVADEGWSVVGVLDEPLADRLLRAVDEVAGRSPDIGSEGQVHQLSGLAQHPDLVSVVDWPPLLDLAVE